MLKIQYVTYVTYVNVVELCIYIIPNASGNVQERPFEKSTSLLEVTVSFIWLPVTTTSGRGSASEEGSHQA